VARNIRRAASGGALAPVPPRATGVGPLSLGCFSLCGVFLFPSPGLFPLFFFTVSELGLDLAFVAHLKSTKIADSLSDLRLGGRGRVKGRYLGAQQSGNA